MELSQVLPEFAKWKSISRLSRDCVVTEKLDGTNGIVYVDDHGGVWAGSRSRWITIAQDNYGFARWVNENVDYLRTTLGFGYHYGEWWGRGIQRNYGLNEKRFSLFNTSLWKNVEPPLFCVPILAEGIFTTDLVVTALESLGRAGSLAAPGFMKPEGVVVFHTASGTLFKKTLDHDDKPKGSLEPVKELNGE